MPDRISLVVFDLGGVLVRIARSWDEAVSFAGLPALSVCASETFALRQAQALADFQLGAITVEQYCEVVSRACDSGYSPLEVERVHHAWSQEEHPGMSVVFDALDAAGIETAVLSNTNAAHWQRLAALDGGAPEYPTVVRAKHHFASHLLGAMKPDPAVFEAVARATDVQPEHILFFDDVQEYVAAARATGWAAEQIDHTGNTAEQLLELLRRYAVIPASLDPSPAR